MENLIFDIGFHRGEDTLFYLLKGCYKVIAVDADADLIEEGKIRFKKYIEEGKLVLLNYAVASENDTEIDFFISQNTLWNSTNVMVSSRLGNEVVRRKVNARRLDRLFREYGVPYYCKIDIEGNDIVALHSIEESDNRPLYVSVETECLGENEKTTDGKELDTIDCLYQLGYRKFKLVDQQTLTVLNKDDFYKKTPEYNWKHQMKTNRRYAKEQFDLPKTKRPLNFTDFFPSSSGPFGAELAGRWYCYKQARELLIKHREDKMKLDEPEWSFWCDWHATF